jgi:DNA-binding response OmpR family regulator
MIHMIISDNDTFELGLTGNVLDSDVAYFLSCGANEVMTKPFEASYFHELMKSY